MKKKVKAAVGTTVEGKFRKQQLYFPPFVEVLPFTLEKGFAGSRSPTLRSIGSETSSKNYAGEKMDTFDWGLTDDD